MSIEDAIAAATAPSAPGPETPAAIQVEDLHKAFRIPTQRVDSLKERAVHPFAARDYRELHALDGISFEVRQGEFFGIVGRNGSGKSTLLKLLASIYRADSGRIRIAGRMAPFIELGVGFNQELTARENVVLNGVMMGLTPREVRARLDDVIEFAELDEFADLKLKNYSSGMLVRLAFSVMLQADADVLLIDEVLAVGDAAFQQKCADAFYRMKSEGRTIVLVTHEMAAVEAYCHRAMLLSGGKIVFIGDPAEAGREYLKLNFEADISSGSQAEEEAEDLGEGAKLLDFKIENGAGEEATTLEDHEQIRIHAEVELEREASAVHVGFLVSNANEIGICDFGELVARPDYPAEMPVGQRFSVTATVENRLAAGRYFVHFVATSASGISVQVQNAASFVVFSAEHVRGVIAPDHEIEVRLEEAAE